MGPRSPTPGDWLSSPGEYRKLVNSLCASDPRLQRRDPRSVRRRVAWPPASSKVTLLEVEGQSGNSFKPPITYNTASALEGHLQGRSADRARRIYILEGLHPGFIATFGDYFQIHPSFWLEHERICVLFNKSDTELDEPLLPSTTTTREHMVLKYFELRMLPANLQNTFRLDCATTGRHIGVTRSVGLFSDVAILRRKCSIWRRETDGGGWDCIVITDPPVTMVSRDRRNIIKASLEPFRDGYVDFVPEKVQSRLKKAPPRTSLHDDLIFYLNTHAGSWDIVSGDPVLEVTLKIIASLYQQLSHFLNSSLSESQWRMSRQETLDKFDIDNVETQWSDIQAMERRLSEYHKDLKGMMIQCRVPFSELDPTTITSWKDSSSDLQFLHSEFKNLATRAARLNDAITALASMAGNRQALKDSDLSLQEAKRTKSITFLGLIFIPLAYTASLFSMVDPYGPGSDHFWVYFAISVPLIVVVVVIYSLVDASYTGSLNRMSPSFLRGSVSGPKEKYP